MFANTKVSIISEGKQHLGAPLSSGPFVLKYTRDKIDEWIDKIRQLSTIAKTQLHTQLLLTD